MRKGQRRDLVCFGGRESSDLRERAELDGWPRVGKQPIERKPHRRGWRWGGGRRGGGRDRGGGGGRGVLLLSPPQTTSAWRWPVGWDCSATTAGSLGAR